LDQNQDKEESFYGIEFCKLDEPEPKMFGYYVYKGKGRVEMFSINEKNMPET